MSLGVDLGTPVRPAVEPDRWWLRKLRPHDTSARITPLTGQAAFGEVAAVVGLGAAGWAVEAATRLTAGELCDDPFLGGDRTAGAPTGFVEALTLWAVLRLGGAAVLPRSLRDPVVAAIHDRVPSGVSVDQGLRCVRRAHSHLSAALQDFCAQVVPPAAQVAVLRRISADLFDAVDTLSSVITSEFSVEHSRGSAGSAAERAELVLRVLDGEDVDPATAVRRLHYDLSLHHLALVLWSPAPGAGTGRELERCATRVLADAGCSSSLVVPAGPGRVWAWGGRASGPPAAPSPDATAVHIAAGLPAEGVAGFRRSHAQATTAERVGTTGVGRPDALHDYGALELVALLAADLPAATEFVVRELDALAAQDESTAALRDTVRCYLDSDRSVSATAAELHIAKNTVVYRMKKAEQLRGKPLRQDRLRLHAALHLANELGPVVLG